MIFPQLNLLPETLLYCTRKSVTTTWIFRVDCKKGGAGQPASVQQSEHIWWFLSRQTVSVSSKTYCKKSQKKGGGGGWCGVKITAWKLDICSNCSNRTLNKVEIDLFNFLFLMLWLCDWLRSWNCNFGTIWLAEMEVWLEARCVLEKLNIFIFIVRVVLFSQERHRRDLADNSAQTLLPDDFSLESLLSSQQRWTMR